MHYSYVMQSEKDNGFHTGSTEHLKLRFEQRIKWMSRKERTILRVIMEKSMFLNRKLKSYLTRVNPVSQKVMHLWGITYIVTQR